MIVVRIDDHMNWYLCVYLWNKMKCGFILPIWCGHSLQNEKVQFIAWVANCITGSKSITQLIMQLLIMESQKHKNVVQVDINFWEFFFDSRKRNQHTYILLIRHCVS